MDSGQTACTADFVSQTDSMIVFRLAFYFYFLRDMLRQRQGRETAESSRGERDTIRLIIFGSGQSVLFSTLVVISPACSEAGQPSSLWNKGTFFCAAPEFGSPGPFRAAAIMCLLFLHFQRFELVFSLVFFLASFSCLTTDQRCKV